MKKALTREECLELLQRKFIEEGRLPKKSDFSECEVLKIKSFFGPWPRALDAAEIKEPRSDEILKKRKEKRAIRKIKKREYKIKT